MMSQNAAGHVSTNSMRLSKSVSTLSSGRRLFSAAVDASGLAVSEVLRAEVATSAQALRGIGEAIAMLQTTDGAVGMLGNTLKGMKTIIAKVQVGTYSEDQKSAMQRQFDHLTAQLASISSAATFNGKYLLVPGAKLELTISAGERISVEVGDMTIEEIQDIVGDPGTAAAAVEAAYARLTEFQGTLGAAANRLESAADAIATKAANIIAAKSRITNADYAKETAKNTSNLISVKMSIAAEVQANSLSKMVLSLLE